MGHTHGSHGSLIVCGNYDGDLEAIAKVLNGLEFDQAEDRDQRFVVHDGRIKPDRFDIDCASAAFPLCGWYKSEDGRRLPENEYRELPDGDDNGEWDFDDYEEVSLADLSKAIAPLLEVGYFGVGFDQALQEQDTLFRKTCDPFRWPCSTPKRGIRECPA